ncbi:hypothetical protein Cni_G25450 [Canna indica]|uniref:Uncharacterized protein n=1 Tax=Canna indica TaxID=4628 RepID=A0AAQ3KX17_9LILI|nr:hypothetical protein Cni_G25450 [Canna indica]
MGGARRSTVEEVDPWAMEDDEGAGWRCRKHHSSFQPPFGVCARCLRDRLLRLCPDCANERPCGCLLPSSSSSSSSSLSSISLTDFAGSIGGGTGIGAVGPVSRLIDSEPAFRRSRSVGLQFLRTRSVASRVEVVGAVPRPRGARKWASFWPFSKAAASGKDSAVARVAAELSRSRSVGAAGLVGSDGREEKGKGWGWHFPSPMNAFRHRRSTKVLQSRSPFYLHRG